jgi:cell division protein FtsI (penicillin-binding protein 3)
VTVTTSRPRPRSPRPGPVPPRPRPSRLPAGDDRQPRRSVPGGRPGTRSHARPAPPRRPARRVEAAPDPRPRLLVLLLVLGLALAGVVVRLGAVQGPGGRRFASLGLSQRLRSAALPAERGSIVDRNGEALAISTRRRSVWADPQAVRDPAGAARALAPLLKQKEAQLRDRLTADGFFVYLARKVDDPVADAVAALRIAGVSLLDEPDRVEPADALAAPLLGKVDLDDKGVSGLELQYEEELAGRAGQMVVEKDPAGRHIPAGVHELRAAAPGKQLVLTLDRALQYETERALADQVVASHAKGGLALVMDPGTGEILAMANLVAGAPGKRPAPPRDNMAVTRVYEPGSVNKLITVAAAVEEGVVRPQDRFVVPDHLTVADGNFRDAEPHPTEWMTVGDIVSESSNVGTIIIGQRLGRDRLDRYLREFGLAEPTNLRFPGESGGIMLDPDEWSGTSIATVPIGQGVAVTALQMLGAYNTVANGGLYVAPRLVKSVVDADGEAQETSRPEPRRVVSEETADAMTAMLQRVVTDGTGKAAAVPGYSVAGKTGTAQKPGRGGYQDGAYVASFAGFVPASAPRLSAIVVLDEPTPIYGGLVAAPVFSQLAAVGARRLGIPPDAAPPGRSRVLAVAAAPAAGAANVAVPTTAAAPSAPRTTTTLGRTATSRR